MSTGRLSQTTGPAYRAEAGIFFSTEAKELRPEGPESEARRAESGVGFLGRGSQPSPHQLWSLGSAISSPAGSGPEHRPPNGFHES